MAKLSKDNAVTHALRHGTSKNCAHLASPSKVKEAKAPIHVVDRSLLCGECVPTEELSAV